MRAPDETTGGALDITPGATTQGHVGQSVTQRFTLLRQVTVESKRLALQAEEFLYRDQFGNCYLTYRALLIDGELYDVTHYVGKQLTHEGTIKPVREWKAFGGTFNDAMIDASRERAFVGFGRVVLEIMKARQSEGAAFVLNADEARDAADLVMAKIVPSPVDDAAAKLLDTDGMAIKLPGMATTPNTPPSCPITSPITSGLTGVDQSITCPGPNTACCTMEGNTMPPMPSIKRGTN